MPGKVQSVIGTELLEYSPEVIKTSNWRLKLCLINAVRDSPISQIN